MYPHKSRQTDDYSYRQGNVKADHSDSENYKNKNKRKHYDDVLETVSPYSPYRKGTAWIASNPFYVPKNQGSCKKNSLRKHLSVIIVDNEFYEDLLLEKKKKKREKEKKSKFKWYRYEPEEPKKRIKYDCPKKGVLCNRVEDDSSGNMIDEECEFFQKRTPQKPQYEIRKRNNLYEYTCRSQERFQEPMKPRRILQKREMSDQCSVTSQVCFEECEPKKSQCELRKRIKPDQRSCNSQVCFKECEPKKSQCELPKRISPDQSSCSSQACFKECTPKKPQCELPKKINPDQYSCSSQVCFKECTPMKPRRILQKREMSDQCSVTSQVCFKECEPKKSQCGLRKRINPDHCGCNSQMCFKEYTPKKPQCELRKRINPDQCGCSSQMCVKECTSKKPQCKCQPKKDCDQCASIMKRCAFMNNPLCSNRTCPAVTKPEISHCGYVNTEADNNTIKYAQISYEKKCIDCSSNKCKCGISTIDCTKNRNMHPNFECTGCCIEHQSSQFVLNNAQKNEMVSLNANQVYPSVSSCRYEKEYPLNEFQKGARNKNTVHNIQRNTHCVGKSNWCDECCLGCTKCLENKTQRNPKECQCCRVGDSRPRSICRNYKERIKFDDIDYEEVLEIESKINLSQDKNSKEVNCNRSEKTDYQNYSKASACACSSNDYNRNSYDEDYESEPRCTKVSSRQKLYPTNEKCTCLRCTDSRLKSGESKGKYIEDSDSEYRQRSDNIVDETESEICEESGNDNLINSQLSTKEKKTEVSTQKSIAGHSEQNCICDVPSLPPICKPNTIEELKNELLHDLKAAEYAQYCRSHHPCMNNNSYNNCTSHPCESPPERHCMCMPECHSEQTYQQQPQLSCQCQPVTYCQGICMPDCNPEQNYQQQQEHNCQNQPVTYCQGICMPECYPEQKYPQQQQLPQQQSTCQGICLPGFYPEQKFQTQQQDQCQNQPIAYCQGIFLPDSNPGKGNQQQQQQQKQSSCQCQPVTYCQGICMPDCHSENKNQQQPEYLQPSYCQEFTSDKFNSEYQNQREQPSCSQPFCFNHCQPSIQTQPQSCCQPISYCECYTTCPNQQKSVYPTYCCNVGQPQDQKQEHQVSRNGLQNCGDCKVKQNCTAQCNCCCQVASPKQLTKEFCIFSEENSPENSCQCSSSKKTSQKTCMIESNQQQYSNTKSQFQGVPIDELDYNNETKILGTKVVLALCKHHQMQENNQCTHVTEPSQHQIQDNSQCTTFSDTCSNDSEKENQK